MEKKLRRAALQPILNIDTAVMLVISVIVAWFNPWLGLACIAVSIGTRVFHYYVSTQRIKKALAEYKSALERESNEIFMGLTECSPVLCCLTDKSGNLYWANDSFEKLFGSQEKFSELAGEALVQKIFNKPDTVETIIIEDKIYEVIGKTLIGGGKTSCLLFWQDITSREEAEQLCADSRPCIAIVDIDNYDEIMAATPNDEQSAIAADLDIVIQNWAASVNAAIVKIKSNRYAITFENRYIKSLREKRFDILNSMHEVETKADFPTSLSAGLAIGEGEYTELLDKAVEACELAQARGGDQLVMRHMSGHTEYFGGVLPTVEKRSKGRSRIMVHSLARLMDSASEVYIMGHSTPDLDAFGAAMGISALAKDLCKPCYIVLDEPGEAIEAAYNAVVSKNEASFISGSDALNEIHKTSLLVVVDTHMAALTECPQLLEKASKLAIIDHHRKNPNAITKADIVYMEVYASSTSELVTEMLEYAKLKGGLSKTTAELLLAGIVLDTKNFTVNTGVRTFDVAAWLRNIGADNAVVRGYFKMRLELYQKKANIIASAEILSNGVAVAYTKDTDPSMQLLVAQAADELLDMVGVEAAFAAGYGEDFTTVSARSQGRINVQVIMEELGGGGHQNVAGAQVDMSPEEAIAQIVKVMREKEIL